jgi:hypothetical protein
MEALEAQQHDAPLPGHAHDWHCRPIVQQDVLEAHISSCHAAHVRTTVASSGQLAESQRDPVKQRAGHCQALRQGSEQIEGATELKDRSTASPGIMGCTSRCTSSNSDTVHYLVNKN